MFDKINLQLFAETVNTSQGIPVAGGDGTYTFTETNNLKPEMKTFYDKVLLREAQANLVHDQFGQKRNIPKNGGKIIEFRKFSSLPKATQPLTEGVTPAGNKLNVSAITAEVSQYGDYIVQSDVLELTSIDNTIVEATQILGNQAGLTMDTIVRNEINAGTNVLYAPKADGTEIVSRATIDTDCRLTVDVVKKGVTILKRVNAPKIDGCYVGIIHPDVSFDLTNDEKWIDVQKYATPENMLTGEIGKIHGVRFVESTESQIFTKNTKCPVYSTLFLGANAYGTTEVEGGGLEVIVKQKGSGGTSDPLNQRSSVGWKGLKTARILSEEYILRVESASSMAPTVDDAILN